MSWPSSLVETGPEASYDQSNYRFSVKTKGLTSVNLEGQNSFLLMSLS